MRGAIHQAVGRARLLLLAVALLFGCIPTAHATRSRTTPPSLSWSQPEPQLNEQNWPLQKRELFGETPLTLENQHLRAESRTRSLGAFGKLTAQWGPMAGVNSMQFSSMPRHANSGMSLYSARAYDPTLQRWLTHDPIGEMGGINLYGFVANNPIGFVDPYGLDLHLGGATGLLTSGPFGYLYGDNTLENLAASVYNALPEAGNILANLGNGLVGASSAADQAAEDTLTRITGDPQLGHSLNNVLAVTPLGLPEDMSKLGKVSKGLEDAVKALEPAAKLRRCPPKVAAQISKAGLPTGGKTPFVPKLKQGPKGDLIMDKVPVTSGPKAGAYGYVDDQGHLWVKDPAHAGYPTHWDVQVNGGADYYRVGMDGNPVEGPK